MEYWISGISLLSKLMNGEVNNSFVSIIGICTILFMTLCFGFFMNTFKYGHKIDTLDKEKEKFRKARLIYERKTNEFADKFLRGDK